MQIVTGIDPATWAGALALVATSSAVVWLSASLFGHVVFAIDAPLSTAGACGLLLRTFELG